MEINLQLLQQHNPWWFREEVILDDEKIERFFELGCEVKGLGRGHINRIKDKVRKRKMGIDLDDL